jgi:flagellar biosynthesis protein FliQ
MEPILIEGIKAVLIVGLPMMVVVLLVGLLIAALQSAMAIREPALGYVARLLAFLAACYLFLPAGLETVTTLAETAWR